MIWFFYNLALVPVFLLLLPALLLRMVRRGGYREHFLQRFGFYSPAVSEALSRVRRVWINASSVGEVGVALSLIEVWRARDPGVHFVLSVSTSTGRNVAEKAIGAEHVVIYAPFDFIGCVRRALRAVNPSRYVLIESELWANLLRACFQRGIPVSLLNARVSDRSFRRMKYLRFLTARLLPHIRPVLAQSDIDAERFVAMGARPEDVRVMGSAKFDLPSVPEDRRRMATTALAAAGFPEDAMVLMGGSTWDGEEQILIDAFASLRAEFPSLRLVLAPRHAERASKIMALLRAANQPFVCRSGQRECSGEPLVFLLNSTGELTAFYSAAHVIFVGKSLCRGGGQNFIEPAALGKVVIVGPRLENFARIAEEFAAERAFIQIHDAGGLRDAIAAALRGEHRDTAERAAALVLRRSGAVSRSLDVLLANPGLSASPSSHSQEPLCNTSNPL